MIRIGAFHVELSLAVSLRGCIPADAGRNPLVDAGPEDLRAVAVEDDDIARGDAGLLQTVDDLVEDQRVRTQLRPADGADLDRDDVAFFEKRSPGIRPSGRAGEFQHAFVHHLLDGRCRIRAGNDAVRMMDFDYFSRVGSGHSKFGGRGAQREMGSGGERAGEQRASQEEVSSGYTHASYCTPSSDTQGILVVRQFAHCRRPLLPAGGYTAMLP